MPDSADYTCLSCVGSEFRPAQDGDCPNGVTLNPVVYDRYTGILERFAADAEKLVSDIWKEVSGKGHGAVVSWMDFEHLVDEDLSTLHLHAIFSRLGRETRVFKLDSLEYWAVSADGRPPDAHVVAAMLASRKQVALGMFEQLADGWRYRWSGDDLKTGIGAVALEFMHDDHVVKGSVN